MSKNTKIGRKSLKSLKTRKALCCLLLFAAPVEADEREAYNLFNPVPADKMREWVTDRPDKTESAYTVDAGHFSHETDLINVSFDSEGGERTDSYLIAAPNLKAGLTDRIDLQVVVESFNYVKERSRNEGTRSKQSGFGDILTRLKVNVWGNDGGSTALAVMPYLKFPTNHRDLGNDNIEGGLIMPMAVNEFETFGIGLMTQVDVLRDADDAGYHVDFVNSITAGVDFTDQIAGYTEIWTNLGPEHGLYATFDCGITYSPNPNLQFDIGLNTGLTQQSDDLNPFIGISQRF